jgi:hypothetical protein
MGWSGRVPAPLASKAGMVSVLIKSFNKPKRNYFFSFARYSGRSFA